MTIDIVAFPRNIRAAMPAEALNEGGVGKLGVLHSACK
jgi:hypothetical protein